MKTISILVVGLISLFGCASVKMVAPKEPIKLDVSMRMDIYQHMQNDINDIENKVAGPVANPAAKTNKTSLGSFLRGFITDAYAEDGLGDEAQGAVSRRHDRHSQLETLESKGAIGESVSGRVEVKAEAQGDQALVDAENNDRMIIYKAIAQKNGGSVDEAAQLYARRLQADAPAGTPIEGPSGWTIK